MSTCPPVGTANKYTSPQHMYHVATASSDYANLSRLGFDGHFFVQVCCGIHCMLGVLGVIPRQVQKPT